MAKYISGAYSNLDLFSSNAFDSAELIKAANDSQIAEYTRQLANFTEGLVIATLLLAAFAFWQVIISRNTAKRQLRAYVFTARTDLRNFNTAMPLEAYVEIKNYGETPAYKLRRKIEIYAAHYPFFGHPEIILGTAESFLGPGGEVVLGPIPMSVMLNSEQIAAITAGTMAVYVHGKIAYFDAFGKEQFSSFRLFYRGNGQPITAGSVLSLSHAETGGNEAT